MESSEEIREALLALQRENDRLRTESENAKLLMRSLESLLRLDLHDDPFPSVFDSLRNVFEFDQVLVLSERSEDSVECIAASPGEFVGLHWPVARFFGKVMGGKAAVTFTNRGIEEWRGIAKDVAPDDRPALYLPIHVRDSRGMLVLIRTGTGEGFDRRHVALGQQFALLASHALAAHQDRQMIRHNEARAIAAEEANKAKNLFVANMSHELRTPLNAIIGFSEVMASEILGRNPIRQYTEYAEHVHASGHHLLAIVNNLLLFAKIEAGQHATEVEPIPLRNEIDYVLRMLEIESRNRDVRLVAAPLPEGLQVLADRQSLRQILLNVVGNALKFSHSGGAVRIELDAAAGGANRVLRVVDEGCGIPPETLDQLGNPFVQAEGVFSRQHQGTGLGLAICFGLAEAMGGSISVDSIINAGTTVTLRLAGAPQSASSATDKRAAAFDPAVGI